MRERPALLVLLAAATWACFTGAAVERPGIDEVAIGQHISKLRQEAIEAFYASQKRIQDVGYALSTGGAGRCGDGIAPVLGASIARRNDFVRGRKKKEVEAAFGVGKHVQVFAVADGSPAALAGLRRGDQILEVDGRTVGKTRDVFDQLRASRAGAPRFKVRRQRRTLSVDLPRVMGCDQGIRVFVGPGSDTVEHKNREDFWVPTGLLDIVRDDDELAILMSHQFGHFLIDRFLPNAESETEADRAGLFLAADAGFDVAKASGLWERIAAEEPWKIARETGAFDVAHGYLAVRIPAIRQTVSDLAAGTEPVSRVESGP